MGRGRRRKQRSFWMPTTVSVPQHIVNAIAVQDLMTSLELNMEWDMNVPVTMSQTGTEPVERLGKMAQSREPLRITFQQPGIEPVVIEGYARALSMHADVATPVSMILEVAGSHFVHKIDPS